MFSTPLTCCSIGVATVSDTTLAFAPGKLVVTWIVGGAISGYWAMGRVESAIMPTCVMTMLITPAKMGRSMKKCGKFIAIPSPALFFLLGRRRLWLRRRSFLLGNWLDLHSRLQQLQTRRHNFLAVFKSVFHDSFAFENTSGLKGATFNGVIRFHHERVFQSLLRADHPVRNQCSPIRRCPGHPHAYEKTGRDEVRVPIF